MGIPIIAATAAIKLAPVIKDAVASAVLKTTARRNTGGPVAGLAVEVIEELAKDKVFVNATSSEKPIHSRITVGNTTSLVGALAFLGPIALRQFGIQVDEAYLIKFFGAVAIVWGPLYSLYGRWMPGLKPLLSGEGSRLKYVGLAGGLAIVGAGIYFLR